jgi:hypothetical protein
VNRNTFLFSFLIIIIIRLPVMQTLPPHAIAAQERHAVSTGDHENLFL